MTDPTIQKRDIVECVDDSPGTQNPVTKYLKKGQTYTVRGVTNPPHDGPDRPLVLLDGPRLDGLWWKAWRFRKKGVRK
jgi:hypothetical protein